MLLTIGETMAMLVPEHLETLERAELLRLDIGGAESNVGCHAAALGQPVRWWSRLGDDPFGRRILERLTAAGVDVAAVDLDPDRPTGLYLKDPGAGVRYYRAGSAASAFSPEDADRLDLSGVQIVHLSGITPALSKSAAAFVARVMDRARAAGITVSFDVNFREALWSAGAAGPALRELAQRSDLVFVGRDEAAALWRTTTVDDVRALLPAVPTLVVKDADHGATAFVGAEAQFEPAEAVDVVEPVGAGDAFAGGYLAAVLSEATVRTGLRAGHRRAALVLRAAGDIP